MDVMDIVFDKALYFAQRS